MNNLPKTLKICVCDRVGAKPLKRKKPVIKNWIIEAFEEFRIDLNIKVLSRPPTNLTTTNLAMKTNPIRLGLFFGFLI
jgi:hypothetical protein